MLKTLIRKQLLESSQFIYFDSKKGKRREKKSLILYSIFIILLVVYLLGIFYFVTNMLAEQLLPLGLQWFYYMLIALLGIVYGVMGSAFTTYSSVYLAKDNDTLLSMPISIRDLMISRLTGVYFIGSVYSCMILIPGIIAGQINGGFNLTILLSSLLMTIFCTFFTLSLSALLGYIVALISVHTRSKAYVTVIISLAAIGIYFYFYSKLMSGLDNLIYVAIGLSQKIENQLFLFYHLGKGFIGNASSIGIIALFVMICIGVTCYLIYRNFNALVTMNKGEKKVAYKEERKEKKSIQAALLQREFLHLSKSAAYMLNCALGTVMMILAGIMILVKKDDIVVLTSYFDHTLIEIGIIEIVIFLSTMNDLTVPSISLEGKTFYMLQTFPVKMWSILMAKIELHMILTVIPALVTIICCTITFKISFVDSLLIAIITILFILLYAVSGLLLNIKFPNFNWINETAAVKQSFSVLIEIFGGWASAVSLGILAYFLLKQFDLAVVLILISMLLAFLCLAGLYYLKNRGTEILSKL